MITQEFKTFIILLVGLLFFTPIGFTKTIEDIYINMPDSLNPTLSKQNRLELLEYYKAGQKDSIRNRFGNKAIVINLDSINNLLTIKNTPVSTFQLKIFVVNTKPTIGIISTVCSSICQSYVQFYDTSWHVMPLKFEMPKAEEWLKMDSLVGAKTDQQWIINKMKISFISLEFAVDKLAIVAKNNSMQFISEEEKKWVEPFVNTEPLTYILTDYKWIKQTKQK